MGKANSTDCLTLNVTSALWERGTFTNGLLGDVVQSVINNEGHVFMIHSTGISILAPGSQSWAAGPLFPTPAECGCNVKSSTFVTIHMNGTNNVREYSVTSGSIDPKPEHSWPSLSMKRRGPGCGATSYHLVVAGGVSEWGEVLASVEVFHIESKALKSGGFFRQARAFFKIIPVGTTHPRLLAVGGHNGTSAVDTSEWWEEEEDSWEEGPGLTRGRSNFAALMAPPDLVCSMSEPPAHSCPSDENTGRTCIFPTQDSGTSKRSHFARNYL